MLGRFIGGFPLGYMGDRLGRKPVLYVGLLSTIIFNMVGTVPRSRHMAESGFTRAWIAHAVWICVS
jgi:MFS family permease